MNAISNTEYITKRYGIQNDDQSINMKPSYDQINKKLVGTGMETDWNKSNLYRSFWGCSPSYYVNSYPATSDDVTSTSNYTVKYWKYNELKSESEKTSTDKQVIAATNDSFEYVVGTTTGSGATDGTAASGYIYTRETTTVISNIKGITNINPGASVASAVIVGYYTVGDETTKPSSSFWIDSSEGTITVGTGKDAKDELHGTLYKTSNKAIEKLIGRQNIVFTQTTTTTGEGADATTEISYTPANASNISDFELKHPDNNVQAQMGNNTNIAGNLVSLSLKKTRSTTYYYYNGTNYSQIQTDDDLNKVNARLVEAGYLHQYNNGLARFSVPIRHLGWDDTAGLYSEGAYQWSKMRIGDLGVVRNHVYHLTIDNIGGLGTGISDPNQPIVPPVESLKQYVASRINVLSWRLGQKWSVDL